MTWERKLLRRFKAQGYKIKPRIVGADEAASWHHTQQKKGYWIQVGCKNLYAIVTDSNIWIGPEPLRGDRRTMPGELAFWKHERDTCEVPNPLDLLMGGAP